MSTTQNQYTARPHAMQYAHFTIKLHELIAEGKGDSQEAHSLTDQMDAPWYKMTQEEHERVGNLSGDLYALAEGGPKRLEMSQIDLSNWQDAARLAFSRLETGDVDSVLDFLRKPIPAGLPRFVVPLLQAKCWEELGDLETAAVFMKEAERHDPGHALAVLPLLGLLGRLGHNQTDGLPAQTPQQVVAAI